MQFYEKIQWNPFWNKNSQYHVHIWTRRQWIQYVDRITSFYNQEFFEFRYQCLQGCDYLHQRHYIHRGTLRAILWLMSFLNVLFFYLDIKPENILIDREHVKIADFVYHSHTFHIFSLSLSVFSSYWMFLTLWWSLPSTGSCQRNNKGSSVYRICFYSMVSGTGITLS